MRRTIDKPRPLPGRLLPRRTIKTLADARERLAGNAWAVIAHPEIAGVERHIHHGCRADCSVWRYPADCVPAGSAAAAGRCATMWLALMMQTQLNARTAAPGGRYPSPRTAADRPIAICCYIIQVGRASPAATASGADPPVGWRDRSPAWSCVQRFFPRLRDRPGRVAPLRFAPSAPPAGCVAHGRHQR